MKILYFTTDFSVENIAFAEKHGLIMRNASAVETAANIESCDFVFGDVPKSYQNLPVYVIDEKQSVSVDEHHAVLAENATLKAENTQLKARIAELESKKQSKSKDKTE